MYAVFPLNLVVLPEESVALHLFEPRYRELFRDHKEGEEFAIVLKNRNGISNYGTLVYIDKIVNEFPDETVDVIVKGSSVIKILEFHDQFPDKLYSGVDAEIVDLPVQSSIELQNIFDKYLEESGKRVKKEHSNSLFYIANRIELSAESKNKLIELGSNTEMNHFLMNEIKFLSAIREQEDLLQQKFHLN